MADQDALEAGWARFYAKLEDLRRVVQASPLYQLGDKEKLQAQVYLHQLAASGYNMGIAPEPDQPRFFTQALFEPIYAWLAPNPDFIYSRTILNPKRTYRIFGRAGDASMLVFQKQSILFGSGMTRLGDHLLQDFRLEPDGSFEIFASPTKQAKNWMPLDASHRRNIISVRRAFGDFKADIGEINIVPVDDQQAGDVLTLAEYATRVNEAVELMDFTTKRITLALVPNALQHAGGVNLPWIQSGKESQAIGGAAYANYGFVAFQLAEDEALYCDCSLPKSLYWGAQLNDAWGQTLDYTYHQSSLGMKEAQVDKDGRLRYVISAKDPGIRNWLDTCGNRNGLLIQRWYGTDAAPEMQTRKIKLSEVPKLFPDPASHITQAKRTTVLRQRAVDVLRRYST